MAITRRDFLKISGITGAGVLFGVFDLKPIAAYAQANPPVWTSEAVSVCGYVQSGYQPDKLRYVHYVQGNPDSPINKGSLCSKGMASAQFSTIVSDDSGARIPHPDRLTQPLKRIGGTSTWTPISWSDAIKEIAGKVKATRASTFTQTQIVTGKHKGPGDSNKLIDKDGRDLASLGVTVGLTVQNVTDGCSGIVSAISTTNKTNDTLEFSGGLSGGTDKDWDIDDGFSIQTTLVVNRCTGIGVLGGSAFNNEAAYLITKLFRALGVVYLETQARN